MTAIAKDIQDHKVVIFDFSETLYMDDSAAMVIDQLTEVALQNDTTFIVACMQGPVKESLTSLDILRLIPDEHIVETMDDAKQMARQILDPQNILENQ